MLQQKTNKLDQILESRHLTSVMNQTKWQKLVGAMAKLRHLDPPVRVKRLNEDPPAGYTPIWWDQLESCGFEWIEWLEIQPTAETPVGLLVPNLKTDYTDILLEVLEGCDVPYVEVGQVFRIEGYSALN